eukprot:1758621-Pyramimonas_sp.AAC.1
MATRQILSNSAADVQFHQILEPFDTRLKRRMRDETHARSHGTCSVRVCTSGPGPRASAPRACGTRRRAQGSGLRAQFAWLRAQSLKLRAQGLGLRTPGLGLKAKG